MATIITAVEYVEIGGIPLATPAYRFTGLHLLWAGNAVRGADSLIPLAAGRSPNPRRLDAMSVRLPGYVFAQHDREGNTYADARTGMWTNVAYLRTNVADPVSSGDGTRAIVVHLADGTTTLSGYCTPEGLSLGAHSPTSLAVTLDISIAAGTLTLDVP